MKCLYFSQSIRIFKRNSPQFAPHRQTAGSFYMQTFSYVKLNTVIKIREITEKGI